ncbi:ATP binding protein [Dorcoceras hygrometricum]|uniref:ATP binding protein n=1 Tax=Dorcoceras hygrometricum TaxID=472368 RepID=A0A2Z7DCF2_9LAMI|nr:ATP binding protein [Dorcoceras hygrometricum]
MGPISNIGPQNFTGCPGQARAKPRRKISHRNEAGDSSDGGRAPPRIVRQLPTRRAPSMAHSRDHAQHPAHGLLATSAIVRQAHGAAADVLAAMRDKARMLPRAQVRAGEGRRRLSRPQAGRFKFFNFSISNIEIRYNYGTIVLKDPSHSSDTIVGELWRIRIPSPGEAAEE